MKQFAIQIKDNTGIRTQYPKLEYKHIPSNPPNKPGMALMRGTLCSRGLMGFWQLWQLSSLYLVSIHAVRIGWMDLQYGQENGSTVSGMGFKT